MSHKILDLNDRDKIYFVGDLHGDFDLFKFAIKMIGLKENDYIVSVGDLIDRGEKSMDCVSYFLNTHNAIAVQGNHEDMMIRSLVYGEGQQGACWMQNGGMWALDYPEDMLRGIAQQLSKLPIALTVLAQGVKIGVCHAESPSNNWEDYVTVCGKTWKLDSKAIWGRTRIKGEPTTIKGVDLTVHGHSVRHQPTQLGNQHWIDTGSVFGEGYGLTISELVEGKLVHYRFVKDCFEVGGFRMV